jgi:hypothetical protein
VTAASPQRIRCAELLGVLRVRLLFPLTAPFLPPHLELAIALQPIVPTSESPSCTALTFCLLPRARRSVMSSGTIVSRPWLQPNPTARQASAAAAHRFRAAVNVAN